MSNTDQIEYWNGTAGQKWVDRSNQLDGMLQPFAEAVIERVNLQAGEAALDIGCGAGALTLMAAAKVGPDKGALGVDVSEPLLALARQRASDQSAPAKFAATDASTFRAEAPVDVVISRFGVMFFSDPTSAFANIRSNVRSDGRMTFICWQGLQKNDWAFSPLRAAMAFLSAPPPQPDPTAPGPFAFQDKDRVAALLSEAGWSKIDIDPVEQPITLPGTQASETARFMLELGPASRLLKEQEIDPLPVQAALTDLMADHIGPDGNVQMASACWCISAVNGDAQT